MTVNLNEFARRLVEPWSSSTLSNSYKSGLQKDRQRLQQEGTQLSSTSTILLRLLLIGLSAVFSLVVSHVVHSDQFIPMMMTLTPSFVEATISYMLPISEMRSAYETIALFVDRTVLQRQVSTLLFVT